MLSQKNNTNSPTTPNEKTTPSPLTMADNLDTLTNLFDSFTENLSRPKDPQPKVPSSLSQIKDEPVSPHKIIVGTMDSTQVDHGIESMIDETNVDEHGRMKNTPLSYDAKKNEFKLFCDTVYGGTKIEKRYTIDHDKVKQFMIYVAFREQKTRGRKKKGSKRINFDVSEWTRITNLFIEKSQNSESSLMENLEPKNGVGWNVLNSTKGVVRSQVSRKKAPF